MAEIDADAELKALSSVLGALTPLETDARSRVLDYVLRRFGVLDKAAAYEPSAMPTPSHGVLEGQGVRTPVTDIRSLAEQKKPKSAIEMAAVVAYYLSHLAPEGERKAEIAASDVTKYFHQANFRLPGQASMTLVHAKNAGYLDAGSKRGSYKLNPVGYNLVAHRLPSGASGGRSRSESSRSQSRRKGSNKTGRSAPAGRRRVRKPR